MLKNQQFIDPQVALQIHKLQQQMKQLIQTKINIQNNDKIKQQTKKKLLKYNEDERVKLRRIIQKIKMSMVEYLDKQVQVISKDCIINGEKVLVNDMNNNNNNNTSLYLQLSRQQQHQQPSQKDTNKSVSSTSTHCRTNSRHSNINQSSSRLMMMNSTQNYNSSQIMEIAEFNLTNDKLNKNDKMNCRKFIHNHNNIISSNSFVVQSSPLLCQSSNRVKGKQRQKLKLTTYLQNQPQSFIYQNQLQNQQNQQQKNQDEQMITQLYNRKIYCLQQKCLHLQQQNIQLQKVITYQQQTIQQITEMLEQKQLQIKQLQKMENKNTNQNSKKINHNNNNNNNNYSYEQQRIIELQTMVDYIFGQMKDRLRENLKFNSLFIQLEKLQTAYMNKMLYKQIVNKCNTYPSQSSTFSKLNHNPSNQPITISYLPQLTPPIHQLNNINSNNNSHINSSTLSLSPLSSSISYHNHPQQQQQKYSSLKENPDILTLTNKLLQLQQTLKKIQSQNQQLRSERSLLLKKIKISV